MRSPTPLASRLRAIAAFPSPLPRFDPTAVPRDPSALFTEWLDDAIELGDPAPNATTFVTVEEGVPAARVLTLRDVDKVGWHLATRRDGRASRALRANSHVALLWYWNRLGRQVRLNGRAVEGDREDAFADYRRRPSADPDVNPETLDWTTWAVAPEVVEFLQASEDRAHLRVEYAREAGAWRTRALEGL